MEEETLQVEDLLVIGKKSYWIKVPIDSAPMVFENWMETPPLPIRNHIPLYTEGKQSVEEKNEDSDKLPIE